ncbi:MAG TPA: CDP-glycerol glycerophosphotransferase family protein [Microbacteriaceae bacterium]|nr:CDP-glycerol glycerophosphotransferase family protein [Microbacteriaceae bacterium]
MINRLRMVLRHNHTLRRLRFAPYALAYRIFTRFAQVRPGRVLFLSDSRGGFSGNIAFLRDEILRQRPDTEVIGLFKAGLRELRVAHDMVRLPWLAATAQTIVLDDYYPVIYPFRIRPETRLVQVWHAAGAFKRVGYSREGLPGGPVPGSIVHRNYTDVTVSSEAVRANYAEAFGIDLARVAALGVPRTDAFFDEERIARATRAVRQRYGIPDGTKIVLYAPTFRGNGQLSAHFDYESVDWEALTAGLGTGWSVLVKMHPFVRPLREARPWLRDVIDVSADREITELLMAADVLVTDYSSTIFEYGLLRRPIVFFCPDLEQYTADRSFYYPFEDYVTGPLVRESSGLAAAIREARVDQKHADFLARQMGACDGHSSERVVRELILPPRAAGHPAAVAPGSGPSPTPATGKMWLRVVVAYAARVLLNMAYAPMRILPRRRKVVLLSREHDTVPADFTDLAAAIRRADPRVRVVTLVRMIPPGYAAKLGYAVHMLVQLYHVATARVLIIDTYAMIASLLRHGDELTVVQVWHALGSFKKFGLSILGHAEGRDRRLAKAMRMHEGYDVVLASSAACRPALAEAFGTPEERIEVAPLPRVDRLRDPRRAAAIRQRITAAYPDLVGRRVAVFAPTFRLDGAVSVDVGELAKALAAEGIHLVVKMHPLMSAEFGAGVDTAPGFSTQEMLQVADLFVTDYSSTLFEAAVVGVPCYFLAPDLDEYVSSRDFYLDYRHDLPGPVVRSIGGLVTAVRAGGGTAAKARRFAERWVEVPETAGPSATVCADRVATLVVAALDRPALPGRP